MRRNEYARRVLAIVGCALWLASSFMPFFGGGAKVRALCSGRPFDNTPPCYVDYLPILEMMAPLVALALLYPFARFAFCTLAPEPEMRRLRWRLASRRGQRFRFPLLPLIAGMGATWALWRASTYPLDRITLPYALFWLCFAGWFLATAVIGWREGCDPYVAHSED